MDAQSSELRNLIKILSQNNDYALQYFPTQRENKTYIKGYFSSKSISKNKNKNKLAFEDIEKINLALILYKFFSTFF